MAKALAAIEARDLANIRLHFGDAISLLDWLPDGALARVDLLYPDPWPKRRHWKRRFVQDATLAEIARVLRPGGEFRFATDIADYAAWTLQHGLRASGLEWTAARADDWRLPWPGFASHALRGQSQTRRPHAVLSDFPAEVSVSLLNERRRQLAGRVCQNRITRVRSPPRGARNWQRLHRGPGSMPPRRQTAP